MNTKKLSEIFNKFEHDTQFASCKELNSGHINDTFLITTNTSRKFVLQRINHAVFKDVPGLVNNKVLISKHLQKKQPHLTKNELDKHVLCFVKTKNTNNYYHQLENNFWNLMIFIDDSVTHTIVKNKEIAFEAGKLLGTFLNQTSDFESSKLTIVIPSFHNMSFRFQQYNDALQNATEKRLQNAKMYIDKIALLKNEMHVLQQLKENGKIPIRVTHNDTKVSNALFTKNNKGICMIDTDTVMPGIVHYDFGDAIRTICNTASEDEKDLNKVRFNTSYYQAYKEGFLKEIQNTLTDLEIKYLPLAVKTMIFIMALRFLTDYLNNDVYYKINYLEHNLDRAKNQFKLLEDFSEQISIL